MDASGGRKGGPIVAIGITLQTVKLVGVTLYYEHERSLSGADAHRGEAAAAPATHAPPC